MKTGYLFGTVGLSTVSEGFGGEFAKLTKIVPISTYRLVHAKMLNIRRNVPK